MRAEIPDGVFKYELKIDSLPLTEVERLLVVAACGTNTSRHNMIYRGKIYAPHLSNYAGAASGRTFPSTTGFETSMTFFTDDEGVYVLDCRDAPAFAERNPDGNPDFDDILNQMKTKIKKLKNGRLDLPAEAPYVEGIGFRYDTDERWPTPNRTGLEDVMEGLCPPHYKDMRAAVQAVCERKFGSGGSFNVTAVTSVECDHERRRRDNG